MSQADHISKIAFSTAFGVDKILWESTLQSRSVPGSGAVNPPTTAFSVSHSLGADTIVEGIFSLDGSNFYPFGSRISGDFGISNLPQWCEMNAYNNQNTVFFRIKNGFDSASNVRYYYWIESIA